MITGVYAGTFDPITNGHLDIIQRSMKFCNNLIIALGINPAKTPFFDDESRKELIRHAVLSKIDGEIGVDSFDGLLVNYARKVKANVLVRGIRSVSDFEYEITLANTNKILAPEIETVFLPTSPSLAVVSSSMVKEIAKHGGNIESFVPLSVAEAIYKKIGFRLK